MRGFGAVFIAVVIGFALTIGAFLINRARPAAESGQPNAELVRASGKCAECHYRLQYSVVHEYEMSVHAQKHVSCLECHQPAGSQERNEHHGFVISKHLTAANCRGCHEPIYQEFLRSRHAAVSWAAVYGEQSLSTEQVSFAEQYHPGYAKRPPHPFTTIEGPSAMSSGCEQCHSVGRPNTDGSIGTCTACHTRHTSSVAVAREPRTCGQCHMGPDHSQIEIYEESKHGVLYNSQGALMNLARTPRQLTTHDMWIPTCATCHMSGINGNKVTHDTSERLSYYLADPITKKRPNYLFAQNNMKQICSQCHTKPIIDRVYQQAEQVVNITNDRVAEAKALVDSLRTEGVLKGAPFTNRIDFVYFDLWHYDGRTSKHGAFMGGADFVQWHGNYPIQKHLVEINAEAAAIRKEHATGR